MTTTTTTTFLFSLACTLFFSSAQGLNAHNYSPAEQGSTTLRIIHTYRPDASLSWQDGVLQMQSNDKTRLQYLSSLVPGKSVVPIASGTAISMNSTYLVKANIGTPAQTLLVAIDISNDAAWIPCTGCVGCSHTTTFNFSMSSTFKPVPCGYPQCKEVLNPSCLGSACGFNDRAYGGSFVSGHLVQDEIALATESIHGYTFACVDDNPSGSLPAQGLLGLGRGPLSLMSQTGNLYSSTFSYCLPSYKSRNYSGSLILGRNGQPIIKTTTPLLQNPKRPSLYYVNLVGIRVGRKVVNISSSAFAFDNNTGGGTIFDSGTMFTSLVKSAYLAVRDEVRHLMGDARPVSSLGGFDTCYTNVTVEVMTEAVSTITLMFSGGMDMKLPLDNFLIWRTGWNTSCLAMAARADGSTDSVLNVIASFQQQNYRVLIDGTNSRLGLAHHQCSS